VAIIDGKLMSRRGCAGPSAPKVSAIVFIFLAPGDNFLLVLPFAYFDRTAKAAACHYSILNPDR
jgi:hypothetical protein